MAGWGRIKMGLMDKAKLVWLLNKRDNLEAALKDVMAEIRRLEK